MQNPITYIPEKVKSALAHLAIPAALYLAITTGRPAGTAPEPIMPEHTPQNIPYQIARLDEDVKPESKYYDRLDDVVISIYLVDHSVDKPKMSKRPGPHTIDPSNN